MARLRERLVAHGETVDAVWASLQQPGAAVTLLFAGPSGVGKRLAARSLAQALLCERRSDGCGQCGSCLRVEAGTHESLLEVAPDGTQIKIDQARGINEFLHLARIGRARVILIDSAQALNPQAANSLLKILEEPPEGTFIFLLAPSPSSMLATLRSRSRTVLFRPLTDAELSRLQSAPTWAVKAARGSVERLAALQDAGAQELRAGAAQALEALLGDPNFLHRSDWRELVREKGAFPKVLSSWIAFARDGLVLHAKGRDELMNPDQKTLLGLLMKKPRPLIAQLAERCLRLEGEATMNRDAQLAVEELAAWWHVAEPAFGAAPTASTAAT